MQIARSPLFQSAAVGAVIGTSVGWLALGGGRLDGPVDVVALGTFITALGTLALALSTRVIAAKTGAAIDAQTRPFLTVGDAAVLTNREVHVRNVGPGMAVVTAAQFLRDGRDFEALVPDPAIPPGETTCISADDQWVGWLSFEGPPDAFSVVVAYADAEGRHRGAVRLDLRTAWGQPSTVSQLHWDETIAGVRGDAPKLSSQTLRG